MEVDYGSPSDKHAKDDRLARQLSATRTSLSFRLGNLIVNSITKPWRLPILPFRILRLAFVFGKERMGKTRTIDDGIRLIDSRSARNCAVLFPTNGVGMGHYARMYALAMAMKRKDPGI